MHKVSFDKWVGLPMDHTVDWEGKAFQTDGRAVQRHENMSVDDLCCESWRGAIERVFIAPKFKYWYLIPNMMEFGGGDFWCD